MSCSLSACESTSLGRSTSGSPFSEPCRAMIRELEQRPESGFLGAIMGFSVIVQYWRSFDQLEAYARNADQLHWPAWVDFNQRVGGSRGRRGYLARDLQSPRRRVRVCVQRDAILRPGKGQLDDGRHWAPRISSGVGWRVAEPIPPLRQRASDECSMNQPKTKVYRHELLPTHFRERAGEAYADRIAVVGR